MSKSSAPIGVDGDLPNYTPISRSTVFGGALIGIGWLAGSIGIAIGLRAMGILGGAVNAPMWVLWCGSAVFVSAGIAIGIQGVADLNQRRRGKADAMLHAGEIWRADYMWAGADNKPGMRSREVGSGLTSVLGMLVVICFTLISTWVSLTASEPGIGVFLWIMSGFMYLFFVLFAWVFVRRVLTAIRFGTPRLVFDTMPIRPGEMLLGTVVCPRGFETLKRISITLRHVVEVYEQSPRTRGDSKTKIRCSGAAVDEWVIEDVAMQIGGVGTAGEIPIAFLIPEDAEDTQALARPARFWDLEIRGEAKGVDFVHRFAVPVYSSDKPV